MFSGEGSHFVRFLWGKTPAYSKVSWCVTGDSPRPTPVGRNVELTAIIDWLSSVTKELD
jgi:hypothetical protein